MIRHSVAPHRPTAPPLYRRLETTGYLPNMVTRTFFRRMLGSLGILLLLASSGADAFALHRCAHHDALPSAQADEPAHHGHGATQPADSEESHGCTCVGTCATTSTAAAPDATEHVVDVVHSTTPVQLIATTIVPSGAPDHLLPFSTAPPASF